MVKYNFGIHEFSFNKIKKGSQKVAIHIFDKKAQQLKIGDVLEMENMSSGEKLCRIVKGLAIFDNFNDLVETLTPQLLGYDNAGEIMLRLKRIYSAQQMEDFHAVGFFLGKESTKQYQMVREEIERGK